MKRANHESPFGAAKMKPSPFPRRNAGKASKENVAPTLDSASPISAKIKSPLPPRPPSSNPLKRKLCLDAAGADASSCSDSGVQVIVRMRPLNKNEEEGGMIVNKISDDSVSIGGHTFAFDSIAGVDSTQQDIFEVVGAPLVENCLAGFNSSVFAYGQTGSGKTYTMWGPTNALAEEKLSSDQQGLTQRVFQRLFARINEEQLKHSDKQLNYQCRCSFLEIYNEQITDLLDPNQRNLQIREDVKFGVYVENLREEYVFTVKDVMRLLAKGLSNRRTGATSINAESSRSHSVFTCVLESRCKRMADGISSLKTSRINLVDLAGSERQKSTEAAGDRLKEAGNINRSLSQLGNLINILAEVSQTGKQRHIPYRDSRLTFLLQESLGGNAKLAMVCAVSPSLSCKSESFSTLRFAQRAKAIKNKAVVNEEMEDDVNHLREVIKQLKDELHRVKANGNNQTGWDPRKSLNLLKSLIHPLGRLPPVDEDGDLEMEIDEEAVENICNQVDREEIVDAAECRRTHASEEEDADMEAEISGDVVSTAHEDTSSPRDQVKHVASSDLSIVPCEISPVLKSPTPSVSPKISISRKSLRTSSMLTASQGTSKDEKAPIIVDDNGNLLQSRKSSTSAMDMQERKSPFAHTENLAASLHRGLEIIKGHRKSLAFRRSALRFIKPTEPESTSLFEKVDVGVQTSFHEDEIALNDPEPNLCAECQNRTEVHLKDDKDYSNLQLVPVDGSDVVTKTKVQVPKAVEKVLAGAIRREMALEDFCAKQASEIKQLNRLVQQYKHERECNAVIGQTREDKILRLESLMDGAVSSEEYLEEELAALSHENQILKEKCENHPDVLRMKLELKSVHDELEAYRNFCDLGEREVLMEEIQDLRTQLNYYMESSSSTQKRISLLKLSCALQPGPSPLLDMIPESTESNDGVTPEEERRRWTEAESKWISLAEELRTELDATRLMAEKQKQELNTEKRCAQELKEAMQMAMGGHARMLEQYADLEEKHIHLLERHRKIQEGIDDVKKAASRAGVRGAESKFINALAAEITALKAEQEKERRYLRDEIRGLQAQLRDTAEAVQAAGELLVRLKEAEEAVSIAERRALGAEQEATETFDQMEKLKRKHDDEIGQLKRLLAQSRLLDQVIHPDANDGERARYDAREPVDGDGNGDQLWKEEFEPFHKGEDSELSKFTEPSSWFTGYDRCNI